MPCHAEDSFAVDSLLGQHRRHGCATIGGFVSRLAYEKRSVRLACVSLTALYMGCGEGGEGAAAELSDASAESATATADDAGTVDVAGLLGMDESDFPYIYFERDKVLLEGIDFDATLKVAALELEKGGSVSPITIWAIRDQIMPAESAARINDLYFQYIDGEGLHSEQSGLGHSFAVWHFAWAVGNIHRLGEDDVKAAIQTAYEDALERPELLPAPYDAVLEEHLTGTRIYMGDAHDAGRAYARAHIVIPGNPLYLQSFEDYAPR
jgi:uncharacterized protein YuzE